MNSCWVQYLNPADSLRWGSTSIHTAWQADGIQIIGFRWDRAPESLTFSDLRFSPKMFKTILQLDPDVMSCISQEYMWVKMLSGGETRIEMQPGHMVTPNALQTVDSLSLAIRKETNWDQLKEKNDSAAERRYVSSAVSSLVSSLHLSVFLPSPGPGNVP